MSRFLDIVTPDEVRRLALPEIGAFVIGSGGRSSIVIAERDLAPEHLELLVDDGVSVRLMQDAALFDAQGEALSTAAGREYPLGVGSTLEIGEIALSVSESEDAIDEGPRELSVESLLRFAATRDAGQLYRAAEAPAQAAAYAEFDDAYVAWSEAPLPHATPLAPPSSADAAGLRAVWRAQAPRDADSSAPETDPRPVLADAPADDEPRARLRDELAALERKRILEALSTHKTQKEAAAALDMPMRTFLNRLDALGITRARGGGKRDD